jgi:5'(3')-deoxyribonucleotidase
MRVYIDLDGTVCDLKSSVEEAREKNRELQENDIRFKYPWCQPGFFLNLKPLPLAMESVNRLIVNHDVWFLSRPSFKNTFSYTEKAEWVRNNFGFDMQKKLILCGDKSLLKGDILIDDGDNANQGKFEGIWIQIGSEKYPDWHSVIKRTLELSHILINSL